MLGTKTRHARRSNEWPFILAHKCTSFRALTLVNERKDSLRLGASLSPLHHMNYGQGNVAFQRDFQVLHGDITSFLEKFCSCQGGAHFKAREACRAGRRFTGIQQ